MHLDKVSILDNNELANKLKDTDGINKTKNRGLNLPNYEYLYKLTKNEFKKLNFYKE